MRGPPRRRPPARIGPSGCRTVRADAGESVGSARDNREEGRLPSVRRCATSQSEGRTGAKSCLVNTVIIQRRGRCQGGEPWRCCRGVYLAASSPAAGLVSLRGARLRMEWPGWAARPCALADRREGKCCPCTSMNHGRLLVCRLESAGPCSKKETVGGPWSRVRRGTVCPRADDEGLRAGIVASRAQPSRLMMITCVNGYGLCVFFVVHRPKRYLWCSEHTKKNTLGRYINVVV